MSKRLTINTFDQLHLIKNKTFKIMFKVLTISQKTGIHNISFIIFTAGGTKEPLNYTVKHLGILNLNIFKLLKHYTKG